MDKEVQDWLFKELERVRANLPKEVLERLDSKKSFSEMRKEAEKIIAEFE